MISKLEISTVHADVDKEINKYVKKKIGKLDDYMPKHARKSAHAEVKLKEAKLKARKESTCEVTIYVPDATIQASETTVNMYAAIDIVEEKLKTQLKKYKDQQASTAKHGARRIRSALGKLVGKK
jgi:putative sigma-54 modulation protein